MRKTFLGILPSVGRVAALLFCAVYMFSGTIGLHFFGGLITREPNNATSYLVRRSVLSHFVFISALLLFIIFYCTNMLTPRTSIFLLKSGRDCFRWRLLLLGDVAFNLLVINVSEAIDVILYEYVNSFLFLASHSSTHHLFGLPQNDRIGTSWNLEYYQYHKRKCVGGTSSHFMFVV